MIFQKIKNQNQNQMRVFLNKIASIQMGYSFRTRLDFMNKGMVAVIQMKDLTGDNVVNCRELMRIDMDHVKVHHLIRPGDIVFRTRGQVNTAAILIEDPGPAVVAAPLIKIHVNTEKVLPAYLTWYINQPAMQAFLASRAKGTAQRMISKQAIEKIAVNIPSRDHQQMIVDIAALAEKEQRLLVKIAARRKNYVSAKLMRSVERD